MHPFADWTIEQLISLTLCVTGIVSLLMSARRDKTSDQDRQKAHASDGWHAVFDRALSNNWVRVTWAVILGSAPINLGTANG